MRYVSPTPTFTYRAVANLSDDPLRGPYKQVIGNNANRVKAGYLKHKGDKWYVVPALTQKAVKWSDKSNDQYIKVYDEDISDDDLPGFLRIGHSSYEPQFHQISFKYGPRKKKTNWNHKGSPTRPSIIVGLPNADLGFICLKRPEAILTHLHNTRTVKGTNMSLCCHLIRKKNCSFQSELLMITVLG
jgi:hypothetical protein